VATRLITHRVARKACRSHVESGTNPAESATVLFTEVLWKTSGCGKGGVPSPRVHWCGRPRRERRGGADSLGPKLANLEDASGRKCVQAVPTKCWPCKSNSVCLGSSPRAQNRVGAFWAFDRALAAGPVQRVYSSEGHSAPFRPRSRSPERCFHHNLRGHASDNGRWALLA
jgi:hypothetical protein